MIRFDKRSFQLAYTRSQMEMAYLDLKAEEVETYQDMISYCFLEPLQEKYEDILKKIKEGNRIFGHMEYRGIIRSFCSASNGKRIWIR